MPLTCLSPVLLWNVSNSFAMKMRGFALLPCLIILTGFSIGAAPGNFWQEILEISTNHEAAREYLGASKASSVDLETITAHAVTPHPEDPIVSHPQQLVPQYWLSNPLSASTSQRMSTVASFQVQPATLQAATHGDMPPSAFGRESHPVMGIARKVPPLTPAEREKILTSVATHLTTTTKATLQHPFAGHSIGPNLLGEFKKAKYLKKIKSGLFVIPRRLGVEPSTDQFEAGMLGVRESKYQMFIWKHVPVKGVESLNIFQLVGMLETGVLTKTHTTSLLSVSSILQQTNSLSAESIFCLCFVTTIFMPRAKCKTLSLETTLIPEMTKGWLREVNRNLLRAIKGEALGREQHYNTSEGDEELSMQLPNDLANLWALA
ncbi:hypothetical protein NDA11_005171 [Ustilago hordei]|nr:hypothetical protein NDA11_005171 [Ustilago hordei]KAJ1587050.1 hypothetical protein NDA15_001441 [Ustilago hordei]KAJ1590322.1 hypothetical protein NDA12_006152 [Ustilago hordei]